MSNELLERILGVKSPAKKGMISRQGSNSPPCPCGDSTLTIYAMPSSSPRTICHINSIFRVKSPGTSTLKFGEVQMRLLIEKMGALYALVSPTNGCDTGFLAQILLSIYPPVRCTYFNVSNHPWIGSNGLIGRS